MEEKYYWVGFNMVRGIGAVRLKKLLDHFNDLKSAWNAPVNELMEIGINARTLEYLISVRSSIDLEKIWEDIQKLGIQVITWMDSYYPIRLKQVTQPPPVIYVRGNFLPEDEWSVAVVGTRRMTAYGRQVTKDLADCLARNRVTIISGMARGIDAIAHQTALQNDGRTIAVLGSGVDQIYPPEHRKLSEEIMAMGCILSEYAPGTLPDSSNFPPRNRIISGLALATVVVEAGETSGALITASFAADQGREVFAVPGNIHSPASKGTNRLIQDGAHPMLNPMDVVESLNLERIPQYQQARLLLPTNEVEGKLLEMLKEEPLHIDELIEKTGLPIEKVSSTLVMMELKGILRQTGHMTYLSIKDEFGGYQID